MRLIKSLSVILIINTITMYPLLPCTLWSAAGKSANNGVLIAKNRDWTPDQKQVLKKVPATKNSFAYFGLYAVDDDDPGFKAGINEKGLVVVTASAGSIPKKEREKIKNERKSVDNKVSIIKTLLSKCDSVAAVVKDKELFEGKFPCFYMIADKSAVMYVEISIDGKYSIKTEGNGVLYHTNHYLDENFSSSNLKIGKSSITRYARIAELTGEKSLFTMDDFKKISGDRHDGADNSIWRTGSKSDGERTMAAWIVALPESGAPLLYVKLANPNENEAEFTYKMDEDFWKNKK